jgi:hypothetical protein
MSDDGGGGHPVAVTIDEMQIDVRGSNQQQSDQPSAIPPKKEPDNLRRQMEMIAERSLRLRTN